MIVPSECTMKAADQMLPFNTSFQRMRNRDALWTQNGLFGLGPPDAYQGDLVCIILGASTPFLLPKKEAIEGQRRLYQLVGECYIYGLMNGEGLAMGEEQDIILT